MLSDLEIYRAAKATITRYGDGAGLHANQRADELLADGDMDGRKWQIPVGARTGLQGRKKHPFRLSDRLGSAKGWSAFFGTAMAVVIVEPEALNTYTKSEIGNLKFPRNLKSKYEIKIRPPPAIVCMAAH